MPPQLPLYHCQLAPVPSVPPLTLSVAVFPEHKVVVVVLAAEAAVEFPELLGAVNRIQALAFDVAGVLW